jgi:hypothetical protein
MEIEVSKLGMSKLGMMSCLGLFGAVTVLATSPAHAGKCQAVDLGVRNNSDRSVQVHSIDYKFDIDNTLRTFDVVPDKVVGPGATKLVGTNVDLLGGEGRQLLEIHAHFNVWCGGQWSLYTVHVMDTSFLNTDVCESNNDREYDIDLNDSNNTYCDLVDGPTS